MSAQPKRWGPEETLRTPRLHNASRQNYRSEETLAPPQTQSMQIRQRQSAQRSPSPHAQQVVDDRDNAFSAGNSTFAVSRRRACSCSLSVPRPTRRDTNSSQLGGAKKIKRASGMVSRILTSTLQVNLKNHRAASVQASLDLSARVPYCSYRAPAYSSI